ncbi:hypothetical protein QYF52_24980 [Paenibacillus polymyxa]|uniref:hypothetical protein n=1 Tax=Paenibacillus polymyxa TaxID=1406 RepID=UPI0025B6DC2D|nr:hypothetical protein [Paenibacillus polymyxa]MDN4081190.1 hypothetical protein [Paenibacillus polymyxa]MDN4106892.1 hypothetical protein [Paenibacillus polymyxa]MDN4116830.1 hypothetical protein [Paenibacillus polymyxa]
MQKFFDVMLKKKFRDHGLDPDEPSSLDDPRYGEFKNEKVYYKQICVTLDYCIRQEWFPNVAAAGMRGRFDPQAKWDGKPVDANDLIEEIRLETFNELAGTPRDDEPKYDYENIKNKLFGTSGLRDNLKQRVGFDTAPYRQFQKYEELKLLKILYRTEKHHSEKVNITKLLGDLSLEIVDRSILGETSVHGQVVTELLTQVHLAIEQRFPASANQAIINLTMAWNEKLLQIGALTHSQWPKEVRMAELQRIRDYGKLLLERLDEPRPVSDKKLLESFYLRVLQLKQIARTHDIDRVTNFIAGSKQTEDLRKQEVRRMPFPSSVITDAVTFVREHMNAVASFIYPGEQITVKHRRFLLKQAAAVPELLALYNKQKIGGQQELTTFFLLSCLQEIELSHSLGEGDDENAFKNEYYLANGKPRTLTSVFKKMTRQMNVEEVFQLVWTIKLERRINANLGRLDEYLLLVDIGTVCNQMINKTMQVPDLGTMCVWNEFLLSQMIVNETMPIVLATVEFDHIITQMTGLSCDLRTMRLFSYFTSEVISDVLTQSIAREIELTMRQRRPEDLQVMKFNLFEVEFFLGFSIDLARRTFVLRFFMPEVNDEKNTLMENAGLGKFANGHERLTRQ